MINTTIDQPHKITGGIGEPIKEIQGFFLDHIFSDNGSKLTVRTFIYSLNKKEDGTFVRGESLNHLESSFSKFISLELNEDVNIPFTVGDDKPPVAYRKWIASVIEAYIKGIKAEDNKPVFDNTKVKTIYDGE